MKRKLIIAVAFIALIFMAAPVDAQNIVRIGRDIHIFEGQQVGSVTVVGGQITVSGLVENNVVAIGGSVVLTGEAVVRGNVVSLGGVVVRGNGAQIFGNISEVNSANFLAAVSSAFYDESEAWSWLTDIIYFCFFALLFILSLITGLLFPRPLNTIISSITYNKAKSFFWGFLSVMMIAPFFMLLVLSFVGIPLIPLAFSLIMLVFVFGFIAANALLGRFILKKTFRHYQPSLTREIILGFMVWWVLGWVPFYTGLALKLIIVITGFGGVLLAVFNRNDYLRRQSHQDAENNNGSVF